MRIMSLIWVLVFVGACHDEQVSSTFELVVPSVAAALTQCTHSSRLQNMQAVLYISGHQDKRCPLIFSASRGVFTGPCDEITVGSRTANRPRYAVVLYLVPDLPDDTEELLVAVLAQELDIWAEDIRAGQIEHQVGLRSDAIVFDQAELNLDAATDGVSEHVLAAREYAVQVVLAGLGLSLDNDGDGCANIYELCESPVGAWDDAGDASACQ